jgi:hypothetical protein
LCLLVSEENLFSNFTKLETRITHGNHVFVQSDEIRKSYRGPSIDVPCKMLLYLAKRFQRRRFLENGPPETRIAYAGHIC